MRPYWKGYLKLALVSCPIALHAAPKEDTTTSFDEPLLLHHTQNGRRDFRSGSFASETSGVDRRRMSGPPQNRPQLVHRGGMS